MNVIFLSSYLFLWLIVIALSITIIGLLKRLKPKAPSLPLQDQGLNIGTIFPKFEFESLNNRLVNINPSNKKGSIIIFTASTCNGCMAIYPALEPFLKKNPNISITLMMVGELQSIKEKIDQFNINIPVISPTEKEMEEMRVSLSPFAYFLSPTGKILAKGGIPAGMQHIELLNQMALSSYKNTAA
ncbi:thioredoxin family protein [Bacillus mycoides]|uniref:TlpA family protein disulfide reductase n=1 Tax=Bacillus mycoides TaxID=1405 RepID=UPI002E23B92B|nr:thioredoxin family protein [Bacillus mycoides]